MNAASGTVKPGFLETFEKEWMYTTKSANPTLLKSEIRNMINFKVLILQYEFRNEDTGTYIIRSVNQENDKILIGTIVYEIANRHSAATSMESLLKGVTFK